VVLPLVSRLLGLGPNPLPPPVEPGEID
jgi:hypothetical protein